MVGYAFILFEMGMAPLITMGIFIALGFGWYMGYAHPKIKKNMLSFM